MQREERNRQTADQQADTVYGIRYGNCFQTAEDRINRADNADGDTKDNNRLELGNAQHAGQTKNIFEYQRAGVQYNRNLNNECKNDVKNTEPELGAAVKPQTDELRNGGDAALEVTRRSKQRQCDTAGSCNDLERHWAHADAPCLAIRTDQLFRRQVGQQQRTRNDKARQTASGKEVALRCILSIILRLNIGNYRYQNGKSYKADECP